jgi:hypothetical protein
VEVFVSNGCLDQTPPNRQNLSSAEQTFLKSMEKWRGEETGYQNIQGTKPQTLGYGLNDSPVGLCAWITEKFRTWSDCNGAGGHFAAMEKPKLLVDDVRAFFRELR